MRPNVVTEASLSTRVGQWWSALPSVTGTVVVVCGAIYAVTLLFGYDEFQQVCFLPVMVVSKWQVYRSYTAVLFHGSVLHVVFNMLALVPIGSGLERILGSVRYLHLLILLAASNAFLHLAMAYAGAYLPLISYSDLIYQCGIGFSGLIFALIVIESSLSGNQNRSIFGLFNVPAKWYPWILLIVFQLLMPNVSFLGHISGILSGFAYTFGFFDFLLLSSSTYGLIEGSWFLAPCMRRQGFIVGGSTGSGSLLPSYNTRSSLGTGNIWRRLQSWMPQREVSEDERFPGQGRTLGGTAGVAPRAPVSRVASGPDLQARLLDRNSLDMEFSEAPTTVGRGAPAPIVRSTVPVHHVNQHQPSPISESQDLQTDNEVAVCSLVAMGFDQTKAFAALEAANGDITLAVEFLSSQE
ncbi:hypothetical protein O6H91_Y365900 [Diphasiastrum complanatum]|nr:hypothetical protein O6H91_Y365900 [Diphasiastrum complanatum]